MTTKTYFRIDGLKKISADAMFDTRGDQYADSPYLNVSNTFIGDTIPDTLSQVQNVMSVPSKTFSVEGGKFFFSRVEDAYGIRASYEEMQVAHTPIWMAHYSGQIIQVTETPVE